MKRRRTSMRSRPRRKRQFRKSYGGRTFKRYKRRFGGRRRFRRASGRSLTVKRRMFAGTLTGLSNTTTGNFWRYQEWSLNKALTNFTGASMGNLPDIASYSGLYENFRINAMKFEFKPRYINYATAQLQQAAPTVAYQVPYVHIVKDGRSNLAPSGIYDQANLNTLMEHGGRTYRADKPFTVYMKGLVRDAATSTASVYTYKRPPFLNLEDAAAKDQLHRGFHMFFYNQGFTNVFNEEYDVYVTYYVTFKNPK